MGRSAVLFLIGAVLVLCGVPTAAHAGAGCTPAQQGVGGCPEVGGSVQGDGAVLEGELTVGGSPGGGGGASGGGPNGAGAPSDPGGSSSGGSAGTTQPCEEVFAGLCFGVGQGKPGDESPGAGIPTVTLSDVAAFRPQDPRQWMQPDGWMIVGLPANLIASTSRHIVGGTLLGAPAEVRFTPVAYRWAYGDGSAARLSTPGASWQALGLSEFDATPTSHVYRASGRYVIELDVEFAVEYRFDGGAWRALAGVVVRPANDLVAVAGEAITVLVDRDCATAPQGPGC